MRHAGINHRQIHFILAGKHIDRGATGQEILDHLPSHILRIGRDAGLGCAVIARENQHLRLIELRVETLLNEADLFGHFFELTEGAERLGLLVDFLL